MASRATVSSSRPLRSRGLATDLRVVRWAAMLFLLADSTDVVVGLVAPSSVVARTPTLDVLQTVLGLAACACLLWGRWRWAVPTTAALLAMMLLRHPVGIEVSLLVVGAAVLAVALPPRAVAVSLAGEVAFAGVLGWSLHHEKGSVWWLATLVMSVIAGVATAAGLVGGRLLREREEAHRALGRLQLENLRIRTDERRALAEELEGILTRDFRSMRATVREASRSHDPAVLRRTIGLVGERSRSTLASVRVALQTLRAELGPAPVPVRTPAWIDALQSPRGRHLLRAVCLVAALLALAYAVRPGGSGLGAVVLTVVVVTSPLTVAVALWRLPVGLVAAVVVLALGLVTPHPTLWVAVPTALLCFVSARRGRWGWIAGVVVVQLAYMAAQLAQHGRDADVLVGVMEAVSICSVLLGLTVCHFETVRSSTRAELEQLYTQQGRIVAEERAGVARELHDVVGHQLSLVSLQALAAEEEHDPEVLRGLVHRIEAALAAGESEIGELVGVLHSTAGEAATAVPALTPTVVATELSRQLQGHRYDARFTIDPRVDGLDPTTQSTLARILQESGTNVLRHAPTGAACSFAVTIDDDTLTFLARSPLPSSKPEPFLAGGYGLRGIRERVDLTGGTFFAGSRDGSWEVQVRMRAQAPPDPGEPVADCAGWQLDDGARQRST